MAGSGRAHDYGSGGSDSTTFINSQVLVVPMCEETEAVENLDNILSVPTDAAGAAEFINLGANFITVSSQGLLRLAGQEFLKRVEAEL